MENLEKKIKEVVNLYKSKKLLEAETLGEKLVKEHPQVSYLYNLLGLIKFNQKKDDEALNFYKKGLKVKPDYAMIYNNLGMLYQSKDDYIKAEKYYKKSINLDNKLLEPQNNLGNLYIGINKHKEAINYFKKSININANFYIAHYNLGIAYKSIGELNKSKHHLKRAIQLYPRFYNAHRAFSQINKYKVDDNHFNILKKLYIDRDTDEQGKIEIGFALGKAYDDIKDFINAFKYYNEVNYLHRKNIKFSINREKDEFNNIKKIFNKNIFKQYKNTPINNDIPIFILGMPRSGTTLVEQILSSHPKVFGGDELIFFDNLIKKYYYKNDSLSTQNIIDDGSESFAKIGREYISEIKKISKKKRITDKLPINFKWIGFIKLILPNTKIVHCVRDPRDTCLSIYRNYFTNKDLNYAYDLNELVSFYNLYIDLMKFWHMTLPGSIIEINYEKLVKNPKKEISTLVKSCGLSWNENCLKFYNNKRPIKTASDSQVRKKIYTSSMSMWKNYKKYLDGYFLKLKT